MRISLFRKNRGTKTAKHFPLALLLFILAFVVLTWSCSETFDLNAQYQEITVVYGLIDPGHDSIFIKINKAFLGEGNVLEMAKIPDSSQYINKLDASIEEWENGSLLQTYHLDTITIDNKKDGTFYNPYQIVYFTPYEPVTSRDYILKINIKDRSITASTNLVNNFSIEKPSAGSKFIMFRKGTDSDIKWASAKYGKRYEVLVRFKFKEVLFDNPDTVYRYVDWGMGTKKSVNEKGGEEMIIAYSNDAFYSFISNQVPYSDAAKEQNVKERYTNDVDFIISVAAADLNTYMEVNEPSNSIVQDKPDYTNVTDGIGLFSSRFKNIRTKKIHPESVQTIVSDLPELKFIY